MVSNSSEAPAGLETAMKLSRNRIRARRLGKINLEKEGS